MFPLCQRGIDMGPISIPTRRDGVVIAIKAIFPRSFASPQPEGPSPDGPGSRVSFRYATVFATQFAWLVHIQSLETRTSLGI